MSFPASLCERRWRWRCWGNGGLAACALVWAAIGVLGAPRAQAEDAARPISDSLLVEPEVMDFGKVNNAKPVIDLQFTIINQGPRSVELTGAHSSCGCTVPQLTKSMLKPGERLIVPVRLHVNGRMGKFENRVMVDVAGVDQPLVVPLKGTLIQDIWYDGYLIQCIVKDSKQAIDKDFELYTVDWPQIEFDWNEPGEGMSVRELSRSKEGDLTTITCRVHFDAGTAEHRVARYAILTPRDKKVRGLTLPVVCYLPQRQTAPQAPGDDADSPKISLGVIARGGVHRFALPTLGSVAGSLKITDVKYLPDGTRVDLLPSNDKKNGSLQVSLDLAPSAPLGPVNGLIHLISNDGHRYTIELLGFVGPPVSTRVNN